MKVRIVKCSNDEYTLSVQRGEYEAVYPSITVTKHEIALIAKVCNKYLENQGTKKMVAPEQVSDEERSCKNNDRELFRETKGDYYSSSLHVTIDGLIGINVGGSVHVMSLRDWHQRAETFLEVGDY